MHRLSLATFLTSLGLLVALNNVSAQEAEQLLEVDDVAMAEQGLPAELQDPAFDQYIDFTFLLNAWGDADAAALADAGLQLAEGERVLFRSHKAARADDVLKAAVQVAARRGDTATLEHLGRAANALGKTELATLVTASQKLASQARTAMPNVMVTLDEIQPSALDEYKQLHELAETARIRGDEESLQQLGKLVSESELPVKLQEALAQSIAQCTEAVASGPKLTDPLAKLSGETRGIHVTTYHFAIFNSVSKPIVVIFGGSLLEIPPNKRRYVGSARFRTVITYLGTHRDWLDSPNGTIRLPFTGGSWNFNFAKSSGTYRAYFSDAQVMLSATPVTSTY